MRLNKANLLSSLQDLVASLTQDEPEPVERATSINDMFSAVDDQIWITTFDEGKTHWLREIYFDDNGSLFAISANAGQLFKWPISVSDDGVMLGEREEVVIDFPSVERSANGIVTHWRGKDGRYNDIAIIATAFLNKDGQIDSTALFEDFEKQFEAPIDIDFHHTGESTRVGEVSRIWRDGVALWAHRVFDDTPMGNAAADTISSDTESVWGNSIEFRSDGSELTDIGDGNKVPVHTTGELTGSSILRNGKASGWYTSGRVGDAAMRDDIYVDLVELVGEELAKEAAGISDEVNERAKEEDSVWRSTDGDNADLIAAFAALKTAVETALSNQDDIELDAETVEAMTESVTSEVSGQVQQSHTELRAANDGINSALTELATSIANQTDALKSIVKRLDVVERAQKDADMDEAATMPHQRTRRAVYRPTASATRTVEPDEAAAMVTFANVAEQTLEALPQ